MGEWVISTRISLLEGVEGVERVEEGIYNQERNITRLMN
jgi:hypothetical protein